MGELSMVSWNVAGRRTRLRDQAACVTGLKADLICLQELRPSTTEAWIAALTGAGYQSIEVAEAGGAGGRSRPLAVLTASRGALEQMEVPDVPWSERVLAVRLADGTEVVNVHSPISTKPELAKVRTHEAIHRHLAAPAPGHERILCGDLNTPRKEHADGPVWTFARDRYGRLRPERGERWDRAELALIKGLEPVGFRDAFRSLHGLSRRELSWEWPRWGGGYRLDHLIVSADVQVTHCEYEHTWRKHGLSDHSALIASMALTPECAREPQL